MFMYTKKSCDDVYQNIKNSMREKDFVIMKPFVFHGTKKENLDSIVKEGLYPSGGVYGTAVYTKTCAHKTVGCYYGNDALVCIYHGTIKNKVSLHNKKDWLLFPEGVGRKHILYVAVVDYAYVEGVVIEDVGDVEGIKKFRVKVEDPQTIESCSSYFNYLLSSIALNIIKSKNLGYIKAPVSLVDKVR